VDLKINRIQHLRLPVTNLKASEAFYKKPGFAKVMASGFDYMGGQGAVAMTQRGEMILERYQIPEATLQEIRNRKDGHIEHIAFDVDSIEDAFTVLKNGAFSVVEDEPVLLPFWENGCKYFNVHGPEGERLELNQIL